MVERDPKKVRKSGSDRITMAEERNRLIRMRVSKAFHFANKTPLYFKYPFTARNDRSTAALHPDWPLRLRFQFGKSPARPFTKLNLVDGRANLCYQTQPRGKWCCCLAGAFARAGVKRIDPRAGEAVRQSLRLGTACRVEMHASC